MHNRLREERKRVGLSQEELAKLVGTNRQTIHDVEYGKRDPRGSLMVKIAHCLNRRVEEIFFISDGEETADCLEVK